MEPYAAQAEAEVQAADFDPGAITAPVDDRAGYAGDADCALPDYLVRHYAWAYLWPAAVWFLFP